MDKAYLQLPQEFVNKLQKIYPVHFRKVWGTFRCRKITAFRINYLKTDLTQLRRQLYEEKVKFRELDYPCGAFLLKSSLRDFQNSDIYRNGMVFVQNISSMIPPVILNPGNSEKILDLCAAPGAKTSQLVSLAPQAEVIAVEKTRKRYYKLLANLKTQGAVSVKVLLLDGIWVRKKFPEYFDKVLVDAPCSGEGRFSLLDKHSYKYWKPRKVKEMVGTQKKLLYAAFFALKEGGELVYSTCTFSPEENEEVVEGFIEKFKDRIETVPIDIPLDNVQEGLRQWKNHRFSSACRLCRRILPTGSMEGFFIAKFTKR